FLANVAERRSGIDPLLTVRIRVVKTVRLALYGALRDLQPLNRLGRRVLLLLPLGFGTRPHESWNENSDFKSHRYLSHLPIFIQRQALPNGVGTTSLRKPSTTAPSV